MGERGRAKVAGKMTPMSPSLTGLPLSSPKIELSSWRPAQNINHCFSNRARNTGSNRAQNTAKVLGDVLLFLGFLI